jgi:hypothetical protein
VSPEARGDSSVQYGDWREFIASLSKSGRKFRPSCTLHLSSHYTFVRWAIKTYVIWDTTRYRCFGATCRLNFQGGTIKHARNQREADRRQKSQMSVHFQRNTRHYSPAERNLRGEYGLYEGPVNCKYGESRSH